MVDNINEVVEFSSFEDKLIASPFFCKNKEKSGFKPDNESYNKKTISIISDHDKINEVKSQDNFDYNQKNNSIFSVAIFNNLRLKNKVCFLCYSDEYFYEKNGNIKGEFFKFYRKIAKSSVGLIFTGGFSVNENGNKVLDNLIGNEVKLEKMKNFVKEIHSYGSKIFISIKSELGRADKNNKFLSLFTYSASFNRTYFNSKFPTLRVTDKTCNKIIDEMVKISCFSKECFFDGILIDGNMFGFIGEISSPETNRRKLGYYSEIYDFSKKLISKIINNNKTCNIIYSISIKSYIEDVYGENVEKIHSIKSFNKNASVKQMLTFMEMLIKCGVDGFVISAGTFETEFLSSPTEFESDNIFEEIYIAINEYFKKNNIKNKFGKDIVLIYRYCYEEFSNNLCSEDNVLIDLTNQILTDNDYIYKIRKNEQYKNCIKCGKCSDRLNGTNAVSCILNPSLFYSPEQLLTVDNKLKQEKIAVVGGGVSGINACLYLARKGYNVELFEKDDCVLKSNKLREIFGYNKPLKKYNEYLKKQIEFLEKNENLKVNLKEKFSLIGNNYLKFTTIIVATGASNKFLSIPGVALKNVKSIYEALSNKNLFLNKKKIVIYARSELSLSFAQFLLLNGKEVSIIIESIDFLINMQNSKLTYYLYSLNKLRCKVYIFAKIKKIESDFVEIFVNEKLSKENFAVTVLNAKSKTNYKLDERAKSIDMDFFVYEPESYSNNSLYYDLVSSKFAGKVFMIGSSLYPCDLAESIKTAFFVAKNI